MSRPAGTWLFAEMFFSGDGKEWSTEFWYDGAGATLPPTFSARSAALALYTALSINIPAIMNIAYAAEGISLEANFGSGTFGGVAYLNNAGINTNDPMPEDVCAVVQKQTATGGRSGSGRWRMSGICEDMCTGSYLNAGGIALMVTATAPFIVPFVNAGVTWTPQLYSRKLNVLRPITGIDTIGLLGTVRRRRPRF